MSWNSIYRPHTVRSLHLVAVREQLEKMLQSGKISQALLFAGPKGTGKTSTSRIIGAIINDPRNALQVQHVYFDKQKPTQPLLDSDIASEFTEKIMSGNSFVVQEMDAASNRGIDDVRQLKARAYLPPQEGNMSVFILDEAHMLTNEAFNALLKLLEEPPEHAIFILATTQLHKIPDTIVSRCQTLSFSKASSEEIIASLQNILKKESLEYEPEALQLIAKQADGSFRDAVKLLELAAQSGKVTLTETALYLQTPSSLQIENLLKHVLNKDEVGVITFFEALRAKSLDPQFFHTILLEYLHTCFLQTFKVVAGESMLTTAVSQFFLTQLSDSDLSKPCPIPHLLLELKILELIQKSKQQQPKQKNETTDRVTTSSIRSSSQQKTEVAKVDPPSATELSQPDFSASAALKPDKQNNLAPPSATITDLAQGDAALLLTQWQEFVSQVAASNSTLSALLTSAEVKQIGQSAILLTVFYGFHKEQLLQAKSLTALNSIAQKVAGGTISFSCEVRLNAPDQQSTDDSLMAIASKVLA